MKSSSTASGSLAEPEKREPVLDTVDRVSEMCFGLFMALTFVGVVSIATAGEDPGKAIMSAALGCNLAWGLADAVMYLIRAMVTRAKRFSLVRAVQNAPSPHVAVKVLREALPSHLRPIVGDGELDTIRSKVVTVNLGDRPRLYGDDFIGALGVFFLVVFSTFPVALPFVLISDTTTALLVSRVLSLGMLFGGGMALGIHAGYGGWKAGFGMIGLGVCLTAAIIALGG
jgi:hypothetical protein